MDVNKSASRRSSKSDLARVDAHVVEAKEYEELPELTEEMLKGAKVDRGGRPVSANPHRRAPEQSAVVALESKNRPFAVMREVGLTSDIQQQNDSKSLIAISHAPNR